MSRQRASDVGFCVVDDNADLIAETLVRRLRQTAAEMEMEVNRLYRGRHSYALTAVAKTDLDRSIQRLAYLAETLREVRKAQRHAHLQAAE